MSAMEPLCHLIGINSYKLSKRESLVIEAELFRRICEQLIGIFKNQHQDLFWILNVNINKESKMVEVELIRNIISDILESKLYTISGIAYYTQLPEDFIQDIASGLSTSPTLCLPRRIIELHRSARSDLYQNIIKKRITI